jgi:phospholipase/carboxylesterase
VNWARKAPGKLKELGIKHQFSEFPVGHGVAPENLNEIKKWLKQKV